MKILHTADWHISLNSFRLASADYSNGRDMPLLINGDIFDIANAAVTSIKRFYTFLKKANPDLQTIITAGNHDWNTQTINGIFASIYYRFRSKK